MPKGEGFVGRVRPSAGLAGLGLARLKWVLSIGGVLWLAAGPASADPVDLSGATAEPSGDKTMTIKDVVKCNIDRLALEVSFGDGAPTFLIAEQSRNYTGTYRQKDPGGRKIVFDLDAPSQQLLEADYASFMADCSGVCAVEPGVSKLKLRGKVTKDRDKLKMELILRGRSQVCSQTPRTSLTWEAKGPLTLE